MDILSSMTKIIENILGKFEKVANKWLEFIDISFLPNNMKEKYKQIIIKKLQTLQ